MDFHEVSLAEDEEAPQVGVEAVANDGEEREAEGDADGALAAAAAGDGCDGDVATAVGQGGAGGSVVATEAATEGDARALGAKESARAGQLYGEGELAEAWRRVDAVVPLSLLRTGSTLWRHADDARALVRLTAAYEVGVAAGRAAVEKVCAAVKLRPVPEAVSELRGLVERREKRDTAARARARLTEEDEGVPLSLSAGELLERRREVAAQRARREAVTGRMRFALTTWRSGGRAPHGWGLSAEDRLAARVQRHGELTGARERKAEMAEARREAQEQKQGWSFAEAARKERAARAAVRLLRRGQPMAANVVARGHPQLMPPAATPAPKAAPVKRRNSDSGQRFARQLRTTAVAQSLSSSSSSDSSGGSVSSLHSSEQPSPARGRGRPKSTAAQQAAAAKRAALKRAATKSERAAQQAAQRASNFRLQEGFGLPLDWMPLPTRGDGISGLSEATFYDEETGTRTYQGRGGLSNARGFQRDFE